MTFDSFAACQATKIISASFESPEQGLIVFSLKRALEDF